MAIISVINQKGGCGKTTTSVNIATGFMKSGYRVLLIDMDPQGHATLGLGINPDNLKKTIFNVLDSNEKVVKMDEVIIKKSSRFEIAPANVLLSVFEQSMAGKAGREARLSSALAEVKNKYDHIVIDCPPSLGLLTINSLLSSSHAIVPIDSGFYALSGVKKLEETLAMLKKKIGHELAVKHLVTFYDTKSTFNDDFLSDLKKVIDQGDVFKSKVRRSIKFNISQRLGKSVIEMGSKKGGIAFRDYHNLMLEVIKWTKNSSNYRITMLREEETEKLQNSNKNVGKKTVASRRK